MTWSKVLIAQISFLQFLEYGFPLGFNSNCLLGKHEFNHRSAIEFAADVQSYLNEEIEHGAIVGPFKKNPIPNGHISPFMTRPKPHSGTR